MAIFRQVNKERAAAHHDALEFPDGKVILLTRMLEGQEAVVLQLPAQPATASEAEAQKRVVHVGVVAGEQLGRRPPAGLVLKITWASTTTSAVVVGPTPFLHPNLANQETETLADRRRRQIYREVLSPSFQLRPRGLTLGPPAKERISRPDRL